MDVGKEVRKLIRAAGGVVVRRSGGRQEIALVHRPAYDDWTFPKGKLLPDETEEEAALREVEEETGLRCRLEEPLGTVRYIDRRGRDKVVSYWRMTALGGRLGSTTDEVDRVRWIRPERALEELSYAHDREMLSSLLHRSHSILLLRHAKAGKREAWDGPDHLRPLSDAGWRQAEALVVAYDGIPIDGIVSSPYLRCAQTAEPLAAHRALPIERSDALAEGADVGQVLALMAEVSGSSTVLGTHGDVIEAVLEHLAREGVDIERPFKLQKGSTWIFDMQDEMVLRARYLPPPDADALDPGLAAPAAG